MNPTTDNPPVSTISSLDGRPESPELRTSKDTLFSGRRNAYRPLSSGMGLDDATWKSLEERRLKLLSIARKNKTSRNSGYSPRVLEMLPSLRHSVIGLPPNPPPPPTEIFGKPFHPLPEDTKPPAWTALNSSEEALRLWKELLDPGKPL